MDTVKPIRFTLAEMCYKDGWRTIQTQLEKKIEQVHAVYKWVFVYNDKSYDDRIIAVQEKLDKALVESEKQLLADPTQLRREAEEEIGVINYERKQAKANNPDIFVTLRCSEVKEKIKGTLIKWYVSDTEVITTINSRLNRFSHYNIILEPTEDYF